MDPRKVRLERPCDCLYSEEAAQRAVDFFNNHCRHTKGRWAGQPFALREWQEKDMREIFGRMNPDGTRQIRTVYKEIPKKNGKTEEAAGVALKLLFADDEPGAEVYGAAADRDQASLVYNVAASMVRMDPELYKACGGDKGIIPSTKRIVIRDWDSYYRALSADVAGKHGFNSHGVIFDEVHAQPHFGLWEVLTFGSGAARSQPLTYAITTAGIPGESPVAEMLHDEADQILRGIVPCPKDFYPVMYAAPDDAPWDDEEVWRSCNPALGDFLNETSVKEEFDRARRRPSEQNSFRRLRLNQWVKQETRFIDMFDWDKCNGPVDFKELKHLTWYAGLDLSTKLDITALVLVALDDNGIFHILPWFWIPGENLIDRPNQETAKYRTWSKAGLVTLSEGNQIDYESIRQKLKELRGMGFKIKEVGFDPWNATQLAQSLETDRFVCVEVRQTYKNLSEPTKELQSALVSGKVRHGGNPVLRWMADCMTVVQDANGNVRPIKPERLKSNKRIDGIIGVVIGMSRAMVNPPKVSVYALREGYVI